jgi:hypothetical protein
LRFQVLKDGGRSLYQVRFDLVRGRIAKTIIKVTGTAKIGSSGIAVVGRTATIDPIGDCPVYTNVVYDDVSVDL